jgi:plastocyanin
LRLAQGLAAGCIIGAILIGASIPAGGGSSSGSTGGTAGTKTVHLASDTFSPDIVTLHTGDTLTLVGDAPVPHTLTNGIWDAGKHAVPGMESGAPAVSNVEINNDTAKIGPFTTPGTYHIFCTVHSGMSLTIIVQ